MGSGRPIAKPCPGCFVRGYNSASLPASGATFWAGGGSPRGSLLLVSMTKVKTSDFMVIRMLKILNGSLGWPVVFSFPTK